MSSSRFLSCHGLFIAFATVAGLVGGPAVARAQVELVVPVTNTVGNDSVTVYARTASGSAAPLRTLIGGLTGLASPQAATVDGERGEVFVTQGANDSVTVYARTASGNTVPLRILGGAATGLAAPGGIALDATNEEIFVANGGGTITVYARTASGNAAPLRTLGGAATGLNQPFGILLDLAHDELFVANGGSNSITVYARTASGNTGPIRTLVGAATGLNTPRGVALDPVTDQLLVTNGGGSVTAYARTASGNTGPARTLAGGATALASPIGLAVDALYNELVVSNLGTNTVTVYARTAAGNSPPLRTLALPVAGMGLNAPALLTAPNLSPILSTGTGAGGGPHVRLFRFDTTEIITTPLGGGFFAYDPGFTGGVQATLVRARGSLFLVTGVGSGGGPHVRLFRVTDLATGAVDAVGPGFFAYDAGFTGGARVSATTDPGGNLLIVTGAGPGGGPHVRLYRVTDLDTGAVTPLGGGFFPYDPAFSGGVNVGAQ